MRYTHTFSIQAKLFLVVILPLFILACGLLGLDCQNQRHKEQKKLLDYVDMTGSFLAAKVSAKKQMDLNADTLRFLETTPINTEKYLSLVILNERGQLLLAKGQPFSLPQIMPEPDVVKLNTPNLLLSVHTVYASDHKHRLGHVILAVHTSLLSKAYIRIWVRNVAILAGLLMFASLLIFRLSRAIRQPINDMTSYIKNMGSPQSGLFPTKDSLPELIKLQSTLDEVSAEMQNTTLNLHGSIKDAQAQLRYQARHDALTGLVNRQELERRLNQALLDVKRYNSSHFFCYMDLDMFRVVNDTCGHRAGDEMLRQISMMFTRRVRKDDTLSRLGGDEFGLLLSFCAQEKAIEIAMQLCKMVENYRFSHDGKSFQTGVSVGIVQISAEMEDVGHITRDADAACYVAKEKGRNQVKLFNAEDAFMLKRHVEMEWVSKINEAIDYNDFVLYCQGIYPLQDPLEKPFYEILIRKRDEQGGVILPAEFLPSAERYGLMTKIDRWTIQHTFIALQPLFKDDQQSDFTVSINLSGMSLSDPHLLAFIKESFLLYEVPPHNVCFEVTETSAIINLDNTIKLITELQKIGTRFMLDDFGSGMSSFSYLKHLPVDFLKMDGTYVRDITVSKVDFAMTKAIQNVAEAMQIVTIAEYVENRETLECLKQLGVGYAQGFYLTKPQALSNTVAAQLGSTDNQAPVVMLDVR